MFALVIGAIGLACGLMGRSGGPIVLVALAVMGVQIAALDTANSMVSVLVIVLGQFLLQAAYFATLCVRVMLRTQSKAAA